MEEQRKMPKEERGTRVYRLRGICAPKVERPGLASWFRPVIRPWRGYFL